ncbi:2945_t:CDS:2, partial [Cetraspora pellucida]
PGVEGHSGAKPVKKENPPLNSLFVVARSKITNGNQTSQDRQKRKNNLPDLEDQEDNDENEEEDNGKDYDYELFRQKGYFDRDIKELKSWGFESGEVPDLLAEKRRGVVNTLSVDTEEKGFCSELVILLRESPHTMTIDNLDDILKINQSQGFADAATISGTSAGSGVYLALLNARFPNCALSKKLAITGVLDTEKKSTSNKVLATPPILTPSGFSALKIAFKNDEIKMFTFVWSVAKRDLEIKNNESSQFCSEKCVNDYYPKTYEEGKIRSIGGLTGKVSAAVER